VRIDNTVTVKDGTTIFYRDTHPTDYEGLTVIALAGLTRNSLDFDYLLSHFDPGLRMVRIDSRGRGYSAYADPASYTVEQESADVLEVMDHLGIERAAFIGTSRGGLIATYLATVAPERIVGVCFNDIGPVIEDTGLKDISNYLGVPPTAKNMNEMAELIKAGRTANGFKNIPDSRWLEEAKNQYIQVGGKIDLMYDPGLREVFIQNWVDEGVAPFWDEFDRLVAKPLAMVRGENSNILSVETLEEMQKRRPDMLTCVIKDRGHVPFLDEPEALDTINAWIKSCQ
jgi:pimeloyl-ACP methyl ester carboxylesterase